MNRQDEEDAFAGYSKMHELAMSDVPAEAVAGRFMKAFFQPFDDFERTERFRGTKPADLVLGELHGAMVLACANAFCLARPGREEQVAGHIRELAENIIKTHLAIAIKRTTEAK